MTASISISSVMSLIISCGFACGGISAATNYHGISYDTATNKVTVKPTKNLKSKSPDPSSKLWDLSDGDEITDQVMSQDGMLRQWHEYKTLGRAFAGNLVLHEEFNRKFPNRVTQLEFSIPTLTGQDALSRTSSAPSQLPLLKSPLEFTHLIYVFRSRDLVQITYNPQGMLVRSGLMQPDGANSIFNGAKETAQNFSKYALPASLPPTAKAVSVNRIMHGGLEQVDFIPKPNKSELDSVFLIHQYDAARIFEILTFDSSAKLKSSVWCKFPSRPVDDVIAKYFRAKQDSN